MTNLLLVLILMVKLRMDGAGDFTNIFVPKFFDNESYSLLLVPVPIDG